MYCCNHVPAVSCRVRTHCATLLPALPLWLLAIAATAALHFPGSRLEAAHAFENASATAAELVWYMLAAAKPRSSDRQLLHCLQGVGTHAPNLVQVSKPLLQTQIVVVFLSMLHISSGSLQSALVLQVLAGRTSVRVVPGTRLPPTMPCKAERGSNHLR